MTPIGNPTTAFIGTFNGNGCALTNLTLNLPATSYVGLFGVVDNGIDPNTICNLSLIDPNIIGFDNVGTLIGALENGTLSTCYAVGSSVNGYFCVGGLVGINAGTIMNSYASGTVTGVRDVGGLVGMDSGGDYTKSFWDTTVNIALTGIGNTADPNVIGESTTSLQKIITYTNAGWDFLGEDVNGTNDIWQL